jgi:hypothetical protein
MEEMGLQLQHFDAQIFFDCHAGCGVFDADGNHLLKKDGTKAYICGTEFMNKCKGNKNLSLGDFKWNNSEPKPIFLTCCKPVMENTECSSSCRHSIFVLMALIILLM